ncbi:MAG TPA: MoxR family ATPase [Planctomycetota bacterium]|nr:MoxR family ATPase [Planctomycetota bacterium]
MQLDDVRQTFESLIAEVEKVIVGQAELVEAALLALFCEGSVLVEGAPGLGKTLLANTLARVTSCEFQRVQFTPDLMPSDLTGHSIFDMRESALRFQPGPVFTNLLLADEVNRSPPKTQSALLEAMQERQVTIDGKTHRLPDPFLVIATQNPIEHEGTYPLPEAQIDRFLFKILVGYPSAEEETEILARLVSGRDPRHLETYELEPIVGPADLVAIREAVRSVVIEPSILSYITAIVRATREDEAVEFGASPRGSAGIVIAARTLAACRGRDFVVPDDVKEIAPLVLRHRLILHPEAEIEGIDADAAIARILDAVPAPNE